MSGCGTLQLINLNELMGETGVLVNGELRFYTMSIVYSVKFGPVGAFNIEKFNRFVDEWQTVMFSGTMQQTTDTLNAFAPFLNMDEIMEFWGGLVIPPPPPTVNSLDLFYPV